MEFKRKIIRLTPPNYVGSRWIFVTICTDNRRHIFSDAEIANWLITHLQECAAQQRFWVHAYCVMPDHIHLLVQGQVASCVLSRFIGRFKQKTAHEGRVKFGVPIWQRYFYDHILRRENEPESVSWYIWMNPVRKGLSKRPEDFPHSGSFTTEWKRTKQPAEHWEPPWKKTSEERHL